MSNNSVETQAPDTAPVAPFIPFAKPSIGEEEISAVVETMRSGWLTTGPVSKKFEQEFAQFVGAPYAVAVNSATAGLHLALEAFGIGPGDKVLTTTFTFTATAEVVRYLGADPVLVDIDPVTFNLDPGRLREAAAANPTAKAIIPVHFGGQACDMEAIQAIASEYGLKIIEDAAHALPTTYDGAMVGKFSDATVFSFYATKTITTGEGGMITTQIPEIAKRMQTMRLHGISRDVFDRYRSAEANWYYEVIAPGFKYNITDIASAIGIQQLKKAYRFQEEREAIADFYTDALVGLPVVCPTKKRLTDVHSWHLYVILLDPKRSRIGRDLFIERMKKKGVGTSVHFIPLHMQPYWRERYGLINENFPIATSVYQNCVSLPIWPGMSREEMTRVVNAVRSILE